MGPLRILHVISTVGPQFGGPTKAVRAMAQALAVRGHHVTVAATDAADDANGRLDVPLGVAVLESGVTYRYFARRPAGSWKFSWSLTQWLSSQTASFDITHVHGLFQYPTLAACRLAYRRGVPYVLRPLGTLDAWSLGQHAWKKRPYLALVETPNIRRAAALHATSAAEAAHLRTLGARRIDVIPLGVDMPAAQAAARTPPVLGDPLRVLFLSRLHPKKGIPLLLEALRLLRKSGVRVTAVIAGAGHPEYEAELRRAATSLGIDDLIAWPGHVEGEEKAALFAGADVFVLPSSQENFGIAVAESLAAGVPVIVSRDVAIAGEVERAGAGVALPLDASRFASAMTDFAADLDRRREAGRAAVALARAAYSWPACAEQLEALYTDLVARKEPPR